MINYVIKSIFAENRLVQIELFDSGEIELPVYFTYLRSILLNASCVRHNLKKVIYFARKEINMIFHFRHHKLI